MIVGVMNVLSAAQLGGLCVQDRRTSRLSRRRTVVCSASSRDASDAFGRCATSSLTRIESWFPLQHVVHCSTTNAGALAWSPYFCWQNP